MDRTSFGKLQLIFGLGLFALAGQTLLFRDFLSVFEGNELSMGFFFASWLTWIAAGAALGRFLWRLAKLREYFFENIALLYVPAFLLQDYLLLDARSLAGVASYEVFPAAKLLLWTFLGNAPLSFITGFLFVLACPWCGARAPVSLVYMAECLGSFAGALLATLLLVFGAEQESVFLVAAALLALSVCGAVRLHGDALPARRVLLRALIPLFVLCSACLCLSTGLGNKWSESKNQAQWERLLPGSKCGGSFSTAQAKYLYGNYQGQFVVSAWGSVCENIPNEIAAREMLTLLLAQKPDAKKFLLAGTNLAGLCRKLGDLPGTERVTWLSSDPDYAARLLSVMPKGFREGMDKLETPDAEFRDWLRNEPGSYDFILLALPQPNSLSANRYYSTGFIFELKKRLVPDGVLAVSFPGGENYMGLELKFFGASLYQSLSEHFEKRVLKPGDGSIFFVSGPSGTVSGSSVELSSRLAKMRDIRGLLPPESMFEFFPQERLKLQLDAYKKVMEETPRALLRNSDESPKSFLYSLLLALKQSGQFSLGAHGVQRVLDTLWPAAALGILCGALVRGIARRQRRTGDGGSCGAKELWLTAGDAMLLVFATGFAGMLLNLLLLFRWQICFGSLFLYFGIVSSLFLLGLSLGAFFGRRLAESKGRLVLFLGLALFLFFIAALKTLPQSPGMISFGVLFLLAGGLSGFFVPLAGQQLSLAEGSEAQSGMLVGALDNLGGALGGLLTALLLLPFLGFGNTLLLLFLATLVLSLLLFTTESAAKICHGEMRPMLSFGQFLTWVALCFVISSVIWRSTGGFEKNEERDSSGSAVSHSSLLFPGETLAPLANSSSKPDCKMLIGRTGADIGYIFKSEDFCPEISGFGGHISVLIRTDRNGDLENFAVLDNRESPEYFTKVLKNKRVFLGKNIFEPTLLPLDSVSGATISSRALSETIRVAGSRFSAEILKNQKTSPSESRHEESSSQWLLLVLALVLTLAALLFRISPTRPLRLAFLTATFLFCGLVFNMQYSTRQALGLVLLDFPPWSFSLPLLLFLLPVLLVMFLGNIYCGYLCPFGALQELIGELGLKLQPGKRLFRIGRAFKYLILFVLVIAAAWGIRESGGEGDILRWFFLFEFKLWSLAGLLLALVLVLSLFYVRFWCRALCPTGAFLSLVASLRLLGKFCPVIKPGRCDLGISRAGELDCISCDHCRMPDARFQPPPSSEDRISARDVFYVASLLVCVSLILLLALNSFSESLQAMCANKEKAFAADSRQKTAPASDDEAPKPSLAREKQKAPALLPASEWKSDPPANSLGKPSGETSDAGSDSAKEKKFKQLIKDGKLSDHPASYWKELKD